MGSRRTAPLILAVLFGALVVVVRLWQIQIGQHEVWADEARKLEHSGEVLPYRRGAIRDSGGEPLAHDQRAYRLELDYRRFRRGHPLGQIAHARSALELRAVPLDEALAWLTTWGRELIGLAPGELYDFARGGPLALSSLTLPRTSEPSERQRAGRASDLRFYVKALLGLSKTERRALVKLERSGVTRASYQSLLADMRGATAPELLNELELNWKASVDRLDFLALRLDWDVELDAAGVAPPPLLRLVDELEKWRASVEDAAASRLFRDVSGFDPGRVDADLMLQRVDLDWLARQMCWEPERVAQWARQARFGWMTHWRDGIALPRLLAELRLQPEAEQDADFALSLLASIYARETDFLAALDGEPTRWQALDALAVVDDLDGLFDAEVPGDEAQALRAALPIHDPVLREQAQRGRATWELLVERLTEPTRAERLAARFEAEIPNDGFERLYNSDLAEVWRVDSRRSAASRRERVRLCAVALLDSWEFALQRALRERFEQLADSTAATRDGRLVIAEDLLDRISERARHLLRDFGSRPALLHREPSYDVVYLITREPARYPGFVVQSARERERLPRGPEGLPLAAEIAGAVGSLDAEWVQRQRANALELRRLQRTVMRSDEENLKLRSLMQELLLADEALGVSGIEAYCDRFLRGTNGYREQLGLEDVFGKGARSRYLAEVENGDDVRLTLDSSMQRAAARVINEPEFPSGDPDADPEWFANPVGAIVLMEPDGRLLALASAPDINAEVGDEAEGERGRVVDRTLQKPTFQPVGSVFKSFVAVHALDTLPRSQFSASFRHTCEPQPGESWAGWGGVRCHSRFGHGEIDLETALHVSCNAYFARIADFFEQRDLFQIAERFGFGEPTGVRVLGAERGLREDVPKLFEFARAQDMGIQMRRATNGLQVVEGTPVQVARAIAGLATGALPEARLIDAIGRQRPLPNDPEDVGYSEASLAFVRRAMNGVANARDGSAVDLLSRTAVGYDIAAKTGSADLQARVGADGDSKVRKHTWIAGWLPADDPELVFVVFLHDTAATSSHSSVPVARQLFEDPAVELYLESRGVPRRRPIQGGPR